jgi:hypothetical protein
MRIPVGLPTGGKIMTNQRSDPKFARESFTWRRMKQWQIMAILAVVVVAVALYFGMG